MNFIFSMMVPDVQQWNLIRKERLRGSLAFFWKSRGVQSPWLAISQTYLSALFSCQRAVAKVCCFHVKPGAEQERGD